MPAHQGEVLGVDGVVGRERSGEQEADRAAPLGAQELLLAPGPLLPARIAATEGEDRGAHARRLAAARLVTVKT